MADWYARFWSGMMLELRGSQGVGLGYGEWGWMARSILPIGSDGSGAFAPCVNQASGWGRPRVVKVCARRKRAARFLYFESSPRRWGACDCW